VGFHWQHMPLDGVQFKSGRPSNLGKTPTKVVAHYYHQKRLLFKLNSPFQPGDFHVQKNFDAVWRLW
jgi:hypothetical protein